MFQSLLLLLMAYFITSGHAPASRVYLDGVETKVRFVDGDTFQILEGPARSKIARPVGFNALEIHGPVHRWGSWSSADLLLLAKKARERAAAGTWRCSRHPAGRDSYGRSLWICLDLALDQVRKGLAHAFSVGDLRANQAIVDAMRKAIQLRVGMWARGIPHYILTSVHSSSRNFRRRKFGVNRLVSTRDGHSFLWRHSSSYKVCQEVCSLERDISDSEIERITSKMRRLKRHGHLKSYLLKRAVADGLRLGSFAGWGRSRRNMKLRRDLRQLAPKISASQESFREGSCLIFVPFHLRYGKVRPRCLR